jgi:hypothetical protein
LLAIISVKSSTVSGRRVPSCRSVPPLKGVGMRSQAYAYPLGVVAILAGLAVLFSSASRVIDSFGDWSWPVVSGLRDGRQRA